MLQTLLQPTPLNPGEVKAGSYILVSINLEGLIAKQTIIVIGQPTQEKKDIWKIHVVSELSGRETSFELSKPGVLMRDAVIVLFAQAADAELQNIIAEQDLTRMLKIAKVDLDFFASRVKKNGFYEVWRKLGKPDDKYFKKPRRKTKPERTVR